MQQSRCESTKAEKRFMASVDKKLPVELLTEFKISGAYQTEMCFHGQVTIKCNTKAFDRFKHGNRCTTYSIDSGNEEERSRPRLPARLLCSQSRSQQTFRV